MEEPTPALAVYELRLVEDVKADSNEVNIYIYVYGIIGFIALIVYGTWWIYTGRLPCMKKLQ